MKSVFYLVLHLEIVKYVVSAVLVNLNRSTYMSDSSLTSEGRFSDMILRTE